LPLSDGQRLVAVVTWVVTRRSTASRLSRRPVRVANSGSSGLPPLLPPDPGIGQIIPSTQDEETLASNLNAGDWNKVSVALSVYELFTERAVLGDSAAQQAGSGLRVPLGRDRGVVKADLADLRTAVQALYDLAGST
jgi:hypothetical protein